MVAEHPVQLRVRSHRHSNSHSTDKSAIVARRSYGRNGSAEEGHAGGPAADVEDTIRSPNPATQDFPFVNVTDSLTINQTSRLVIRSQATRDFYKRVRQREHHGQEENPAVEISGHQVYRFRFGPKGHRSRKWPKRNLGATNAQPALPRDIVPKPSLEKGTHLNGTSTHDESSTPGDSEPEAPRLASTSPFTDLPHLQNGIVTRPQPTPSAGRLDPFDATPIRLRPRLQFLLQYFYADCSEFTLMIYYRTRCFGLCLHDPLLIYLTLSKSAEYLSLSGNPRAMLNEFLWLRTEAIRIINERIGTPELESSDGVIDAVAHMAMYECASGKDVTTKAHLAALKSMVSIRGGLSKADMPSALQRIIAWCELCTANALDYNPWSHITSDALEILTKPTYYPQDSPYRDATVDRLLSDREDVQQTLAAFRSLSAALERTPRSQKEIFDNPRYSDEVYHLQRTLMKLTLPTEGEEPMYGLGSVHSAVSPADQCICAAALLYLHVVFFNCAIEGRNPEVHPQIQRLIVALTAEGASISFRSTLAIVWTLAIGGIVAGPRREERRWFVLRLVELGIDVDSEKVLTDLRRVVWHKDLDERRKNLWEEVKEAGRNRCS